MGNEVCAIWVLDDTSNAKLNDIIKVLDLFGIEYNPIYGHITFSYFINVDVDEIKQYTKKFAADKRAFNINCSALALLTTKCIACILHSQWNYMNIIKNTIRNMIPIAIHGQVSVKECGFFIYHYIAAKKMIWLI